MFTIIIIIIIIIDGIEDQARPSVKFSFRSNAVLPTTRCDVVTAHIQGKKFKKAFQWYTHNFSEFLPDIVEHSNNIKQLYCTITGQSLNKIPDEVRRHINGKKFKR